MGDARYYKLTTIESGGQEWPQFLFCELPIQMTDVLRDLNAQSAEIAGLRETVKRLEQELGVAYLSINGAFLVIEPTLRMLEAKRTPAPIPNPSEIPNSSTEVQDAAKGC